MAVAAKGMRSNSVGVLVGVGVSVGVADGISVGVGISVSVVVSIAVNLGVIEGNGFFRVGLFSSTMTTVVGDGVTVPLVLRHPAANNEEIKKMQRTNLTFEKKFDSNIKRSHLCQHKPTSQQGNSQFERLQLPMELCLSRKKIRFCLA